MNSLLKIFIILSILTYQCDSIDTASLPRDGNNAVLIGKKIYYIGGRTGSPQKVNTFLLDLSSDFTANEPNFIQVFGLENLPSPVWTAACLGKDNTIYIFAGTDGSRSNLPKVNTLYKIKPSMSDDVSLSWIASSPNQADTWPSARDGIFPIIDSLSRIFVWGGRNEGQDNKTMYIYEGNKWSSYNLNNAPNPRSSYTATLLNDGRIIYIGGLSSSPYPDVNFSELSTSNKSIRNRAFHSAILHMNSISIIMYGGLYYPTEEIPDSDSVWVLNTKNWEWSQPSISSLPYMTVTRGHTAVLYNGYMIVAFVNGNYSYTSEVKVMDVANLSSLAWVPTYKVRTLPDATTNGSTATVTSHSTSTATSTETVGDKSKNNLGLFLGGAVAAVLLIVASAIFFMRRRQSPSNANIVPNSESHAHPDPTNDPNSEYYAHSNNEPVSAELSTVNLVQDPPVNQNNSPLQQANMRPYQQYNQNLSPHQQYLPMQQQYNPNSPMQQHYNPNSPMQQHYNPNSPMQQHYYPNSPMQQHYNPNSPSANQYSTLAEIPHRT
ncbi:12552_t:CDS:2 [Ambispora gerdemannii]|uniref:12552_t:CDS:1 n=1 Tax=Ambispora gerdemannii TaxID=144530 RepID=A0A9N8YVA6_9GLOM|nr:12552_t:CDS:2 [Ambispora gerdemannii]